MLSRPATASLWGEENAPLYAILAQAIEQVVQLAEILKKSEESIALVKEINQGIREAMDLMKHQNRPLSPGILSDLRDLQSLMSRVERIYGRIPKTSQSELQQTGDTTVAESLHLHNEAFRFADAVDPEAERIKDYAKNTNPLGAQRLTAQSVGVLINVLNQVLRTNATLVKLQSEELALRNRELKNRSRQYQVTFDALHAGFSLTNISFRLNRLSR
jgi:hypothetical protein